MSETDRARGVAAALGRDDRGEEAGAAGACGVNAHVRPPLVLSPHGRAAIVPAVIAPA
jgi:hypothetical protein